VTFVSIAQPPASYRVQTQYLRIFDSGRFHRTAEKAGLDNKNLLSNMG
jgi:hypothetical protein